MQWQEGVVGRVKSLPLEHNNIVEMFKPGISRALRRGDSVEEYRHGMIKHKVQAWHLDPMTANNSLMTVDMKLDTTGVKGSKKSKSNKC